MEKYRKDITKICASIIRHDFQVNLDRPDEDFGDLSTNVALVAAKSLGHNPKELAHELADALKKELVNVSSVEVAGPGFINITFLDKEILGSAMDASQLEKTLDGQQVVAEYSDPNPFKTLHAGHLYTSLVGDAIANLQETAGAKVHRVNFGGDVGLHVAKSMWAIIRELGGENPKQLQDVKDSEKLSWLSQHYVAGNKAYETDENAKQEIITINKRVYEIHSKSDKTSPFAQIYWTCRQWSYDGFDALYSKLQMQPFEKYYPESAVAQKGLKTVEAGLSKDVFKKSDGAIVFDGESVGLHTRVFVNSEGLPTYEAKDLGLSLTKWQDYSFDKSLIITGDDITEYMKVIIAVVRHFEPQAAERTIHRTHGQIKLAGGVKMSSRLGNVLTADDILQAAFEASKKLGNQDEQVVLGAVRYSFLKNRLGGDIIYTPQESVSMEGNSGPYIQYALVRARSILQKVDEHSPQNLPQDLQRSERSLARKISMYPEVFALALNTYSPHHICNYLYELAQNFNGFYEHNRVIGDDRQELRISLVKAYEQVLSEGLKVLGMPRPKKM